MINKLPPTGERTAFYPASARDYLEPLQLLNGFVDQLIFCDIQKTPQGPRGLQELRAIVAAQCLPDPSFFLGDALTALACLRPVDIFFVRRDSSGEGGSGLALLHTERIRLVLNMIKPGGLLVTDKPNGFLWLTRMLSGKSPSYPVEERTLYLSAEQPWANQDLYSVTVA